MQDVKMHGLKMTDQIARRENARCEYARSEIAGRKNARRENERHCPGTRQYAPDELIFTVQLVGCVARTHDYARDVYCRHLRDFFVS